MHQLFQMLNEIYEKVKRNIFYIEREALQN